MSTQPINDARPSTENLSIAQTAQIAEWKSRGRPAPPPHIIKQQTLRDFANKFGLKVLVETGTFYGAMVEAMRPYFGRIYSIELSEELYENAKKRFDGDDKITIIHGDSGIELGKLLARIEQPALFWLDGHHSGRETARGEKNTPIYEELTHIFNSRLREYVVIIDDARCFGTIPDYPSIGELSDFIKASIPNVKIEVENDSIRIIPHGWCAAAPQAGFVHASTPASWLRKKCKLICGEVKRLGYLWRYRWRHASARVIRARLACVDWAMRAARTALPKPLRHFLWTRFAARLHAWLTNA